MSEEGPGEGTGQAQIQGAGGGVPRTEDSRAGLVLVSSVCSHLAPLSAVPDLCSLHSQWEPQLPPRGAPGTSTAGHNRGSRVT